MRGDGDDTRLSAFALFLFALASILFRSRVLRDDLSERPARFSRLWSGPLVISCMVTLHYGVCWLIAKTSHQEASVTLSLPSSNSRPDNGLNMTKTTERTPVSLFCYEETAVPGYAPRLGHSNPYQGDICCFPRGISRELLAITPKVSDYSKRGKRNRKGSKAGVRVLKRRRSGK